MAGYIKALFVSLLVLTGIAVAVLYSSYNAAQYYASELAAAHIQETVQVGQTMCRVNGSTVMVQGKEIHGATAWRALKLAYEVTLARRAPLFAVAGNDPAELAAAAEQLATAQAVLASKQTAAADSKAIQQLYPITFIVALADLEKKRDALLAHPTEETAAAYEGALPQVLAAKSQELTAFKKSFTQAAGAKPFQLQVFSGLLTATNEEAALSALQKELPAAKNTLTAQIDCVHGFIAKCTGIPTVAAPRVAEPKAQNPLHAEISALWDASFGAQPTTTLQKVLLTDSQCLSMFASPYTIRLVTTPTPAGNALRLLYEDNLFFTATNQPNAPFLAYERDVLGIGYTPVGPLTYYTCPQLSKDVGAVVATLQIRQFAAAHPSIAPAQRSALLANSAVASQHDAYAYLQAALDAPQSADAAHALEELALLANQNTGGLAGALQEMAHIISVDTKPELSGISDTSARMEFLTHSAFPYFFTIGSNADISKLLYTASTTTYALLFANLIPYTTLRTQTSRSYIVEDLRKFLLLENRIPPAAPSSAPTTKSPK